MSCVFCKNYQGLNCSCTIGTLIQTLSESFDCDKYEYNGECKSDK